MARICFEDFTPGETATYGAWPVTREEIVDYARQFDPQPFHLDEEAGRASLLGGLSASGWHSAALLMRMTCEGWLNRSTGLGSPGIDELRWMKPVLAGDTLTAVSYTHLVYKRQVEQGLPSRRYKMAVCLVQRHRRCLYQPGQQEH